jgi:hypothetical protein
LPVAAINSLPFSQRRRRLFFYGTATVLIVSVTRQRETKWLPRETSKGPFRGKLKLPLNSVDRARRKKLWAERLFSNS